MRLVDVRFELPAGAGMGIAADEAKIKNTGAKNVGAGASMRKDVIARHARAMKDLGLDAIVRHCRRRISRMSPDFCRRPRR